MVICLAMKKIEELKWKEFRLLDLFTFQKGNQKNMNSLQDGETPLVSAKKIENGYKGFYKVDEKEIFDGGCLTLNNDGDGGAGLSFYQPSSFALDTHVTALYPIEKMSRKIMLFISCCISKQSVLFGHGHSINTSRLNNMTIMLPCDCTGESPNYAFMEQYMNLIEKKQLMRYKQYLKTKGDDMHYEKGIKENHKWKEYDIKEIFPNILRGRRLKTDDHIIGTMPYVSSSAMDNGVDNFVSNTQGVRIFNNCLTIANSGSVGATFYHPYSFVASDHVTSLANEDFNKYIYLFGGNITSRLSEKYSFNREIKDSRLQREKIMLPVNKKDEPDYKYIEKYMRNIEYRLINRYINNRLKILEAE